MNSKVGNSSRMTINMQRVRTVFGYAALAIGVTAGGTLVGATIVAPVVSRAEAEVRLSDKNSAKVADKVETRIDAGVLSSIEQDAAELRATVKHSRALRNVPEVAWLYLGLTAAFATIVLVGWRLRVRSVGGAPTAAELATRATAALLAKPVVGRHSRTPRAVLALAEAGNAPADIARRTGLSLDAVAMCLSLSSFAARQLRPPTA
ncbi:MAG: hypothetical protein ABJC26_16735 [Gemmatimonadaceae bacterium]